MAMQSSTSIMCRETPDAFEVDALGSLCQDFDHLDSMYSDTHGDARARQCAGVDAPTVVPRDLKDLAYEQAQGELDNSVIAKRISEYKK